MAQEVASVTTLVVVETETIVVVDTLTLASGQLDIEAGGATADTLVLLKTDGHTQLEVENGASADDSGQEEAVIVTVEALGTEATPEGHIAEAVTVLIDPVQLGTSALAATDGHIAEAVTVLITVDCTGQMFEAGLTILGTGAIPLGHDGFELIVTVDTLGQFEAEKEPYADDKLARDELARREVPDTLLAELKATVVLDARNPEKAEPGVKDEPMTSDRDEARDADTLNEGLDTAKEVLLEDA